MARHRQRPVRVRPERPRRQREAAPPPAQARRAPLRPVFFWGVCVAVAAALAIALILAVGAAGFAGPSRWGFIGCLFILGMTILLCGAKAAEAFLNWREPGWQPTREND